MIRRQGDLGGEWDRMRLGERQKMISGEREIEPLFHEKSAALKNKMEGAREKEPILAVHDAKKYPTLENTEAKVLFSSRQNDPIFQPENMIRLKTS